MKRRPLFLGAVAVVVIALAFMPAVLDSATLRIVVVALIWGLAASAWNLAGGFAGQLSLGHGLYFGVGAYAAVGLYVNLGVSPPLGILAGCLLSIAVAALVALITFRARVGHLAFAVLTLALALIGHDIVGSVRWLGAREGLFLPLDVTDPLQLLFSSYTGWYYLVFGCCLAFIVGQKILLASKLGRSWLAMRDNADAAAAMGVNVGRQQVVVAAASAALTAVAGGLFALFTTFIDPTSVLGLDVAINLVLFAIVGGLGTVIGPYIGAASLVLLSYFVSSRLGGSGGIEPVIYGVAVIAIVLSLPRGLSTLLARFGLARQVTVNAAADDRGGLK